MPQHACQAVWYCCWESVLFVCTLTQITKWSKSSYHFLWYLMNIVNNSSLHIVCWHKHDTQHDSPLRHHHQQTHPAMTNSMTVQWHNVPTPCNNTKHDSPLHQHSANAPCNDTNMTHSMPVHSANTLQQHKRDTQYDSPLGQHSAMTHSMTAHCATSRKVPQNLTFRCGYFWFGIIIFWRFYFCMKKIKPVGYTRTLYSQTGKNTKWAETFVWCSLLIFKVVYRDHLTQLLPFVWDFVAKGQRLVWG